MANPLLDFVMSLVRDPDAAAQYAADPAGAIQAANLTDVTSADVNALIPVVSESLSTAMPGAGADSVIGETAGNIWSSGAATSAFDAFDDHLSSVPTIDDGQSMASNVIERAERILHEWCEKNAPKLARALPPAEFALYRRTLARELPGLAHDP